MRGCLAAAGVAVALALLGLVIALLSLFSVRSTNIRLHHGVEEARGNVEVQLQRRLDLVANAVATVKEHVRHEEKIVSDVTSARKAVAPSEEAVEKALAALQGTKFAEDPENMLRLAGELSTKMGAYLHVVVENYPSITATESFRDLRAILEGSENRIAIARQRYNESVAAYNAHVDQWGFLPFFPYRDRERPFEADPRAHEAPVVRFD